MLKIQRKANGDVVFTVSGRLEADNVSELSALLAAEQGGRNRVLDLKDLVFYASFTAFGIVLAHQSVLSQRWRA